MYLVDTNVWLERLLSQAKSAEVAEFLNRVPSNELYITDFAFHSICVITARLKREAALLDFVQDVFVDGAVTLIPILPGETRDVVDAMKKLSLDFDDAYQYVAAEKHDLVIVTFDNDLNGTPRGKKTPAEVVAAM